MAYTPENNPYIPGDPYSYDLKWIISEIKRKYKTIGPGEIVADNFSDELKLLALKDYATPEMYGAIGDGTADDTEAVQKAIDSGKNVLLIGAYKITTVIISAPVVISGGTVIIEEFGHGFKILNASDVCIYDTKFIGTNDFKEGFNQIDICEGENISIIGCSFINPCSDGITISGGTLSELYYNKNITIDRCIFKGEGNGRNGISVISGESIYINDCQFSNITSAGMPGAIDIEPNDYAVFKVKNVKISNCTFNDQINGSCISLVKFPNVVTCEDFIISNCTFNHEAYGISCAGNLYVRINGCTFNTTDNNNSIACGDAYIDITDSFISGIIYGGTGLVRMSESIHAPIKSGIVAGSGNFAITNCIVNCSANQYCINDYKGIFSHNKVSTAGGTWFTNNSVVVGTGFTTDNTTETSELAIININPFNLRTNWQASPDAKVMKVERKNITYIDPNNVSHTANNCLLITYSLSTVWAQIALHNSGVYFRSSEAGASDWTALFSTF